MARYSVWLAVSIALVGGMGSEAAPLLVGKTPVVAQGETKVVALLGGTKVSADFLSHEVPIGSASDRPPRRRTLNCTYSHVPCMLIDSLELAVDGHAVYVPRSAFADLSDVWTAKLQQIATGRFRLTLEGGDASEGYLAEIIFDRVRVRERKLVDGEAQKVSEKTVYFDTSDAFD